MDDAAAVLLIIVSVVLTIFLVIFIIALIYAFTVLRRLKHVASQAEQVSDSVRAAAAIFEKTAAPLAIIKLISKFIARSERGKKDKE